MVNFLNKAILSREDIAEEILEYEDPRKALNYLAISSEEGKCPDLILLDINMPKIDGWEFMSEYSLISSNCYGTKVVMLTSSIDPSDKDRALNTAGVTAFKSKPLTPEMINDIISEFFL